MWRCAILFLESIQTVHTHARTTCGAVKPINYPEKTCACILSVAHFLNLKPQHCIWSNRKKKFHLVAIFNRLQQKQWGLAGQLLAIASRSHEDQLIFICLTLSSSLFFSNTLGIRGAHLGSRCVRFVWLESGALMWSTLNVQATAPLGWPFCKQCAPPARKATRGRVEPLKSPVLCLGRR